MSYQHENHVTHSVLSPRARVESQQQRYRAAYHVTQKLASCAAEVTGHMFDVRLQQLTTLLRAWEQGEEVVIETASQPHEPAIDNRLPDLETITEIPPPSSSDDDDGVPNVAVAMAEGHNSVGITTVNDTSAIVSARSLPAESDTGASSALTEENTNSKSGRRDNDTVNILKDYDAEPMLLNDTGEGECATSSSVVISASSDLGSITLPPHIRKRGRPKGSELTIVGLPKKRLKLKRRPVPFCQLETSAKDKMMLKWFVDDAVAERCIT
ncbi:hypothetical protein DPMN_170854 [Dreissena polymorpha]|uniref:Uncharacterized protein n=1 Tax=Dreissena polymorpha TaxID=45954 RepID=A0A9D4IBW9_DREPO|nr:hypothetical protein DPMN_170854 [Dreissena polymorpha]